MPVQMIQSDVSRSNVYQGALKGFASPVPSITGGAGRLDSYKRVDPSVEKFVVPPVRYLAQVGAGVRKHIRILKDRNAQPDARRDATYALGRMCSYGCPSTSLQTSVITVLIGALGDTDGDVRAGAAWALGKNKDSKAVVPLLKVLRNDKHGRVLIRASTALTGIFDMRIIPGLLSIVLYAKHSKNRYWAVVALRQINLPKCHVIVPTLVNALKTNRNWRVRKAAAEALQWITDKRAERALMVAVKKDRHAKVRAQAVSGLMGINNHPNGSSYPHGVVTVLIGALNDRDRNVRSWARFALSEQDKDTTVPQLIAALKRRHARIRMGAAWALGRLGTRKAAPALIGLLLKDRNGKVRYEAANALGKIGDRRAVIALIVVMLKDKNAVVRTMAAEALGTLGDKRALSALAFALKDPKWQVRKAAKAALRKIMAQIEFKYRPDPNNPF